MLLENPKGNYLFLKGIGPYSAAVVAAPGYELVHVTLDAPLPLQVAFQLMASHLADVRRPIQAACAIELVSPRPFSFAEFATFNERYCTMLADADLLVDGLTPMARTNIVPEIHPPAEPSVSGFSYSVTQTHSVTRPTFAVAGASELLNAHLRPEAIIRFDDVSPEAIREKAAYVLQSMTARLKHLGVTWNDVNVMNAYTVHDICPFLRDLMLPAVGRAGRRGVNWQYARPPVRGLEFEMDVRSVRGEVQLA